MTNQNRSLSLISALALPTILTLASQSQAQLIADSVADFSGVQGTNGWFNGFYDGDSVNPYTPADFEILPLYDVGINGAPPYWHNTEGPGGWFTVMRASRMHPNGRFTSGGRREEDQWVVRRWVSNFAGSVHVRTSFVDLNTTCGNGIRAHIFVGNTEVFNRVVDSATEQIYETDMCVQVGTMIDFAVDPLDSWDACDNTGNTIMITGPITSQPASTRTCLGGAAMMRVGVSSAGPVMYQWRKDSVPLQNGPHFDGVNSASLMIRDARLADAGMYDCILMTCGGAMSSHEAALRLCLPDYNCDGFVNSQDFFDFCMDFMNLSPRVDYLNHDGFINSQDFLDFMALFFQGCA